MMLYTEPGTASLDKVVFIDFALLLTVSIPYISTPTPHEIDHTRHSLARINKRPIYQGGRARVRVQNHYWDD